MNKEEIFKKLEEVNLAKEEIMIIGDASLVVQDIIEETNNIDIACSKEYFNSLDWEDLDLINILSSESNKIKCRDVFEITTSFYNLENAITINGYNFMNLEECLNMKRLYNKKQDKKIIEKLDLYLSTLDNYRYERKLRENGIKYIAGVDEVGRGPLVGPVVAACVVLPEKFNLDGLTDSKKLSKKKREYFYEEIKKVSLGLGIGIVDEKTIDKINIYEATKLAMQKAIDACKKEIKIEHILIDAMKLDSPIPTTSIIKGDLKSITISAASVIAKVTRDNMMLELDKKYPMYGFKTNMGYPTKKHVEAIEKYGIIEEHRKTYSPVSEYLKRDK